MILCQHQAKPSQGQLYKRHSVKKYENHNRSYLLRYADLALCSSGLDQKDITIVNHVVLSLGLNLPLRLNLSLATELLELVKVVDNGLDESLLEIAMDDTSRLRRLGAVSDSPLADLIGSGGEEAAEVQDLAHGGDNLRKGGLDAERLQFSFDLLLCLKAGQTLLEADGYGEDRVSSSVLLKPLGNLAEMLVLLANIVLLAEVDQVHDGLSAKEE